MILHFHGKRDVRSRLVDKMHFVEWWVGENAAEGESEGYKGES